MRDITEKNSTDFNTLYLFNGKNNTEKSDPFDFRKLPLKYMQKSKTHPVYVSVYLEKNIIVTGKNMLKEIPFHPDGK